MVVECECIKVLCMQLCRRHWTWSYCNASFNVVQLGELRSGCKWGHVAMARKKASLDSAIEESNENESVVEKKTTRSSKTKRATARAKKKSAAESPEENTDLLVSRDASIEESSPASSDDSKKKTRRTRRKGNLLIFVSMLGILSMIYMVCL